MFLLTLSVDSTQAVILAFIGLATVIIPSFGAVLVLLIKQLGILRNTWHETMRQSHTLNDTIAPAVTEAHTVAVDTNKTVHGVANGQAETTGYHFRAPS